MVKIILFPLIYIIGFCIGILGSDVNEIGSSISVAVSSGSGIENTKSFSEPRVKRTVALLVPYDDNEELSEEHHKIKRCWKTRPVKKVRLALRHKNTENLMNKRSGSTQSIKCNVNKLYNDEKSSVEKSEESWESNESWEDDSEGKFPYLKLVPVKNFKDNFKEILGIGREIQDDGTSDESKDAISSRNQNYENLKDYNVLALVGKKNSYPLPNGRSKYICYCRQADCTGGNCQRMTYRPCSTCKNPISLYGGKGNSNGYSNYYKNQYTQSPETTVPSRIQYQLKKDSSVSSSTSAVSKFDHSNSQQSLSAVQDGKLQWLHDTPRAVSTDPNNDIKPLDQYRNSYTPMQKESETDSRISGSRTTANNYSSAPRMPISNDGRYGNTKFMPDHTAYNQWENFHYPSIEKADDLKMQNHQTNTHQFMYPYRNNVGFAGPKVQFANHGIVAYPQPVIPGSYISQTSCSTQPQISTNFHSIFNDAFYRRNQNGYKLGSNAPSDVNVQAYPQKQQLQIPIENSHYQEETHLKSASEESAEEIDSQIDLETGSYDETTESNINPATILHKKKYTDHRKESREDSSEDFSSYEDSTQEQTIIQSEDQRKDSHESGEYKFDINSQETVDPLGINEFPKNFGGHETLGLTNNPSADDVGSLTIRTKELYNNRNSLTTESMTNNPIIHTEKQTYDDQTDYSSEETSFESQVEPTIHEQSNWDRYNERTTQQTIVEPKSNTDVSVEPRQPESHEDTKLVAAIPKYFHISESQSSSAISEERDSQELVSDDHSDIKVVTNGYFTSMAYNDFGKPIDGVIPVTDTHSSHEHRQHELDTHRIDYTTDEESEFQNENVAITVDKTDTDDYVKSKTLDSLNIHGKGYESLDEPTLRSESQGQEDDTSGIMISTDRSSSDEIFLKKSQTIPNDQSNEFLENNDEINYHRTSSIIPNIGGGKNLQASNERKYSSVDSAESNESNTYSAYIKSDDQIKEAPLIEVRREQETDSVKYKSIDADLSGQERTRILNEEDARETDVKNSEEHSKSESIESYEDASPMKDDFTEYIIKDIPKVLSGKHSKSSTEELVGTENINEADKYKTNEYQHRVVNEHADVTIENTPTKYYSPDDRVLEYIKQHGQNLERFEQPGNNEQPRTQDTFIQRTGSGGKMQYVAPEIYHRKLGQDESGELGCQESNSESESEEIFCKSSKNENDSYDYDNGVRANQDFPSEEEGNTFIQSPRYEELNNEKLPNYGGNNIPTESMIFKEHGDEETVGKSPELQNTLNAVPINTPSQILTKILASGKNLEDSQNYEDHDNDSLYSSEEDINEKIKVHEEIKADSDTRDIIINTPISFEKEKPAVLIGDVKKVEEDLTSQVLGEIQHSNDFDYKSTEANSDSYNTGKYDGTTQQSSETIAMENPMDMSTDDYDLSGSTESSLPLGNIKETSMNSRFDNSEIIHTRKEFSSHNYDDEHSNESSNSDEDSVECSTDYSIENSSDNKYTQYNLKSNVGSAKKIISSCKHRIATKKLTTESVVEKNKLTGDKSMNSFSEKNVQILVPKGEISPPEFQIKYKSSDETSDILGAQEGQLLDLGSKNIESPNHEEDSIKMKNVELVSSSQSIGCCTKPSEVQDDPGYLGRIKPKKSITNVKTLGDLIDSELFYIGDGVKLPLTLKKLNDGSLALSISDKICEQRWKEICPCCVPKEGKILQQIYTGERTEESVGKNDASNLRRRAVSDDEESHITELKLDNKKMPDVIQGEKMSEKSHDHGKRTARSISMPVDEFVEKYNLILDLNDQLLNNSENTAAADASLKNNVIQRHERTDDTYQVDEDLVRDLVSMSEVPESQRTVVFLSTLQKLIATDPTEVFRIMNETKEKLHGIKPVDDDREDGISEDEKTRYSYQKDNPILDRIRIIKELQKKAKRCEHRYQRECDDAITQKTELLTMILYWLKDLMMRKEN